MKNHNYFVYILTNKNRTVLYTGVTNNLITRLTQLRENKDNTFSFIHRYNCFYLIYFEKYVYIDLAIQREKKIKGWLRRKKIELIERDIPEWRFLNEEIGL